MYRKKEADVASLKELLNATLSDLMEQSKLDWKDNPDVAVANSNSDKYSIRFSHRNLAEQMAYYVFLTDHLTGSQTRVKFRAQGRNPKKLLDFFWRKSTKMPHLSTKITLQLPTE